MILQIKENDYENVIKEGCVIIDFFATWCTNCKMQMPFIERLSNQFNNVKFYKVDASENKDLAENYNIMTLPTIQIYNNGKLIETIVGFKPYGKLVEILNSCFN